MQNLFLIVDEARPGPLNMAIDETILHEVSKTGDAYLRFYTWSEPTLSLGYFQKYEDRRSHLESVDCAIVRRSTGGGAIMHHHELTYSLCVPSKDRFLRENKSLYDLIHDALIQLFEDHGLNALRAVDEKKNPEPFLCFLRRSEGDILIDGSKVGGSAQRRFKHAILQHGSLLLRKSPHATELVGINDFADSEISSSLLVSVLTEAVERQFDQKHQKSHGLRQILDQAAELAQGKYCAQKWLMKR